MIAIAGEAKETPDLEAGKAADKHSVTWRNGKDNLSFFSQFPNLNPLGFVDAELAYFTSGKMYSYEVRRKLLKGDISFIMPLGYEAKLKEK